MPTISSQLSTRLRPLSAIARASALILLAVVGQAVTLAAAETPNFSADDLEFFEKEVRPILVARCYECHSGKAQDPKGGLRLDSRAALLRGGETGPAVVPGNPQQSLLVGAVNYGDLYQMPPKSRLPRAEVEILTKWVARGAPWPKESTEAATGSDTFDLAARQASHWCWRPMQFHSPPSVISTSWVQQDIDRFTLAKLEERGIPPARKADKRALIRRAYFDFLGLPPSTDEVEQFVRDDSPQAFEHVVDRLLESPHFGERWARHWLDVVRYAETCGHEFDYPIHHAWRFRDYVIRALNSDLPYDQFVLEQVAGDLLPNPRLHTTNGTNESIIGSGFWFLHEATHAPVDVRGDQAIRVDNQIDVFSKTFLGLTVACARCHDHKFDAISTKDYYAMAGYLHSSRRQEAMLDPAGKIHEAAMEVARAIWQVEGSLAKLAGQSNEYPLLDGKSLARFLLAAREVVYGDPVAGEPQAEPGQRRNLAVVAQQFDLPPDQLRTWLQATADARLADPQHPLHPWHHLALRPNAANAADFDAWRQKGKRDAEQSLTSAEDFQCFADFDSGTYNGWFVTGESFSATPTHGGQWDALSDGVQLTRPGMAHSGQLAPAFQGVLRSPTFTLNHRNIFYRLAGSGCEVRLIVDGYTMIEFHQLLFKELKFAIDSKEKEPAKVVWQRQAGDLGMYLGHRAYIEIIDHGGGWAAIDGIWFSDQNSPPPSQSIRTPWMDDDGLQSIEQLADRYGILWHDAMQRWREGTLTADDTELINWVLRHGLGRDKKQMEFLNQKIATARQHMAAHVASLPTQVRALAMADGTGENQRVSVRGNPRTPGEEAPRQRLTALGGTSVPIDSGSGRLQLARQLVDPTNPLTARVIVNRLWQHMFGRGIVASVDNFGVLGERPTHPELLDYLAYQFIQDGWSIKRMLRTMALSATYQMSSLTDGRATEADPTNALWHAMPIRRLEGEAIRDAMLAISGRLDRTLEGPSIGVHITPFMQGRGKPAKSGPLDGAGRRSIYLEVRRNFLPAMMLAFDTPIPFNTVGRRNLSNVPAQALILMNDPFVIDQSRHWAERLLAGTDRTTSDRIRDAYLAAFSRPPTDVELAQGKEFIASQGQAWNLSAEQSERDARVWSDFCHVLFNVKEFVFLH